MEKLSEILNIIDVKQREKELCDFARSLNINPVKAKNEQGVLDENKLAVFIYDEFQERKRKKSQSVFIIGIVIVLFIIAVVAMAAVSKVVVGISANVQATEEAGE